MLSKLGGSCELQLSQSLKSAAASCVLLSPVLQAVITQPDLLHKLPSKGLHTLLLHPDTASAQPPPARHSVPVPATISYESLGAAADESPEWKLGQLGGPDTTCYIIFTSGSTGKPKVSLDAL